MAPNKEIKYINRCSFFHLFFKIFIIRLFDVTARGIKRSQAENPINIYFFLIISPPMLVKSNKFEVSTSKEDLISKLENFEIDSNKKN